MSVYCLLGWESADCGARCLTMKEENMLIVWLCS